jgi:TetR/AcrR family transcriptional regulator, transcriptional repressor of aconitase
MMVLTNLPSVPTLSYGSGPDLERQICEFILRGVGLNAAAIALHLDREPIFNAAQTSAAESA